MEILNTYFETVPTTLGIIAAISFCIGVLIFAAVTIIGVEYSDWVGGVGALLGLTCLICLLLTLNNVFPFDHKEVPHYEIILDDDYPASKLIEQYEITEVKGQIFDCIDKNAG